jgi:hypothetical protein
MFIDGDRNREVFEADHGSALHCQQA